MEFSWVYTGEKPIKLRSALKQRGVTSSLIKAAIFHGGQMTINHEVKWAVDLVEPGDRFAIDLPPEVPNDHVPICSKPFDIIYEDRDFLVINKAAGVATVPAHNVVEQDSLVNRVKYYYQKQGYENQVTHVATRLDKDTSGLVIFPKHRFAHAVLDNQLKRHLVKKEYVALVSGQVATRHGYIDAPIQRDPESFVQRQVGSDGKAAVTEYWLKYPGLNASIVKIRLHTGRTHQIRVHFSYLGHPLLGDAMYGGPDVMARQALHCQWLSFYSPFLNRQIELKAPIPSDMTAVIEKMTQ